MSFEDALTACKQGSQISRSSWIRKRWITLADCYGDGTKWLCYRKDGLSGTRIWVPQQTDILANDWQTKAGIVH